jgi:putative secretion ATPase (PEP-CTERM system associated)
LDHDPYGLTDRPFQLTPDPRFYFESATHRKAMTYLGYGLAQGEGFIVVTGEVGTGKTMLVGRLMATIDRSRLTAINLVSTQLEGEDILRIVALALGVTTDVAAKGQLLARIERFLHEQARGGKRTLLIVDEAQNLPISALEELRMLSNFQYGGQALLQIFLLGQPEFRDALAQPRFEQLRQRVIATHHLTAMGPEEVAPYVMHRLACAGWKGTPRFTQDAYDAFHRLSGGIPRRLNMLAGRVMLQGAIERLTDIDGEVVDDVASDLASESIMPAQGPQPRAQAMPSDPDPVFAPSEPEPAPQPAVSISVPPLATPFPAPEPMPYAPPEPSVSFVAPVPPLPADPSPQAVQPSYTSYAPPEEEERPASPSDPLGGLAADPLAALRGHFPPPAIEQPPRFDGNVPPELSRSVVPEPPAAPSVPSWAVEQAAEQPPEWPPVTAPAQEAAWRPTPEAERQPVNAPVWKVEQDWAPPLSEPAAPPASTMPSFPPPQIAEPLVPQAAPTSVSQPVSVEPTPAVDPALVDYAARNAELETRLAEQEAILRRTLTLLVELVETDPQLNPQPAAPVSVPPRRPDGGGQGPA